MLQITPSTPLHQEVDSVAGKGLRDLPEGSLQGGLKDSKEIVTGDGKKGGLMFQLPES